jgi:iron complex transport system substrate-binding protein
VRNGRVFAVDANSYFARPGPRVVEGTELLAHLIHPEAFAWDGPPEAFRRLEFESRSEPRVEKRGPRRKATTK